MQGNEPCKACGRELVPGCCEASDPFFGPTSGEVRLVALGDSDRALRPGTTGRVLHVDDVGTVHVQWKNGAVLGLIPGIDRWEAAK